MWGFPGLGLWFCLAVTGGGFLYSTSRQSQQVVHQCIEMGPSVSGGVFGNLRAVKGWFEAVQSKAHGLETPIYGD